MKCETLWQKKSLLLIYLFFNIKSQELEENLKTELVEKVKMLNWKQADNNWVLAA